MTVEVSGPLVLNAPELINVPMGGHGFRDDGRAQPRVRLVRRSLEERLEEMRPVLVRHAGIMIAHHQRARFAHGKVDAAADRHMHQSFLD